MAGSGTGRRARSSPIGKSEMSRRSRELRKHARAGQAPPREPAAPARASLPPPPAEGWKLMSTSVPHLRDAPWWVRLAMATLEKAAILSGVALLGAGVVVGTMAAVAPSFRGALLRWLLAWLWGRGG